MLQHNLSLATLVNKIGINNKFNFNPRYDTYKYIDTVYYLIILIEWKQRVCT